MSSEDEVRAAWAPFVATRVGPVQTNVQAQAWLVRALLDEARPLDVLGERLAGVDGVAAEALVVLPPGAADPLLDPLAQAVTMAAPLVVEPPEDDIGALDGLTVLSCANALMACGHETIPAGPEPAGWLDLLAHSKAADDAEVERRATFVVAAAGSERLLRPLAELADSSVPQPEDLPRAVARALVGRRRLEMGEWPAWLANAPEWLAAGAMGWADLLWSARAVHCRIEGNPVDSLASWLREEVGS